MDWFKFVLYGGVFTLLAAIAAFWMLYALPLVLLGKHHDHKYGKLGLCPRCKRAVSVRHVPPHLRVNRTPEQIEHLTCYCRNPPPVRVRAPRRRSRVARRVS